MASLSKNYLSFVSMGGLNPQILNLDFLKTNKIIPTDDEQFSEILKREKPLTRFVSVPGFANLVLENIEFIIDENRFQLREIKISDWSHTKILAIADKYFKVLPYTPLKVVGINLNSSINFESPQEAKNFQEVGFSSKSEIAKVISVDNITASIILQYPYKGSISRITIAIAQPDKGNKMRTINCNYEFDFKDWSNFQSELNHFSEVASYCDNINNKLVEIVGKI
jgi:hypothetical protein